MKILKYLLYALLALVVIGVILGLVGPKTYDVHRSKVIAASSAQVWPYVSNWEKINMWSPWVRMDTTLKLDYTGDQGSVGSKYSWTSKKMGSGEQTITALEPNHSLYADLKINMHGEMEAKSSIMLHDTAGGTEVTWGMKGENNFMGRIMSSVMNMDKMIGKEYEKGLNSLDSLMATVPKTTTSDMKVNTEQYPGGQYLGIRSTTKISKLSDFFSANMTKVIDAVKKSGAEMAGMPSGLYFVWEPDKDNTDVAAAIPIAKEIKAPAGLSLFTLPASKAAVIDYMGGYSGLGKAHEALAAFIKENNLTQSAPVIEEYLVDPMMEKDSTKWHTKIVYFVK